MTDAALFDLMRLATDRAIHAAARDAADINVRKITKQMFDALVTANEKRVQLPDATVVQIIEPAPRQTILPEKLLSAGVDPSIIRDATKYTPTDPYVRVFPPGAPQSKEEARAANPPSASKTVGDAPESHSTTRPN